MLPVVDNLERAVAHTDSATDAKAIADGINLVLRQFVQAFERPA
jgi:molecular chaperone GrpE (heat shock protein)